MGLLVTNKVSAILSYWDKGLICRFANNAYLEWFGKTHVEMVDKMSIKELFGPILFELNEPHILGALQGKEQVFEREIPLGETGVRHCFVNYYPDIQNGEVKGFVVHVADVTPIKMLEKELVRTNQVITEQNS